MQHLQLLKLSPDSVFNSLLLLLLSTPSSGLLKSNSMEGSLIFMLLDMAVQCDRAKLQNSWDKLPEWNLYFNFVKMMSVSPSWFSTSSSMHQPIVSLHQHLIHWFSSLTSNNLLRKHAVKNCYTRAWVNGSAFKSANCSCRG